ncbi:MAG: type 4a pilus biogenesis protein PilO [Candidatus Omnitrophica bacterium]|nr:type 4a pilus biogenesis protein PilO [Candidatus Omnitrophota bacterium]
MGKIEVFEKNKSKVLNLGVVILALFIAFQIYKSADERVNSLIQQKDEELKKNKAAEEIAGLERKIEGYKKIFVKEDVSSIINTISNIAKNCSIKIVSIKPSNEEVYPDYIKSVFLITVSTPDYHSLGNFISQIESYKDIYMVDELGIASAENKQSLESANMNLNVNLKISTIFYQ